MKIRATDIISGKDKIIEIEQAIRELGGGTSKLDTYIREKLEAGEKMMGVRTLYVRIKEKKNG